MPVRRVEPAERRPVKVRPRRRQRARLTAAALAVLIGAVGGVGSASADDQAALAARFPADALIVVASGAVCVRFDVFLALTPAQQARGLMYVRKLPPGTGMLFLFGHQPSMWMKNTFIPLDMVFIDAGGEVADVAPDTEPMSLAPIRSARPATAVLELNAGVAARWGIAAGDVVLHPAFGTWPLSGAGSRSSGRD